MPQTGTLPSLFEERKTTLDAHPMSEKPNRPIARSPRTSTSEVLLLRTYSSEKPAMFQRQPPDSTHIPWWRLIMIPKNRRKVKGNNKKNAKSWAHVQAGLPTICPKKTD